MGRGVDYKKSETLDRDDQKLTEAESERLEKLLDAKNIQKLMNEK